MSSFPGRGHEKARLRGSIGLCLLAALISASSVAFLPTFQASTAPAIQSPSAPAARPQLSLSGSGAYVSRTSPNVSSMKLLGGLAGLLLVAALRPQIARPRRSRGTCSVACLAQASPVSSLRRSLPVQEVRALPETYYLAEATDLLGLDLVPASVASQIALPSSILCAAASPSFASAAVSTVLAAPASCDFIGAAAPQARGVAARRIGSARAPRSRRHAAAGGSERQQRRMTGARLQASAVVAEPRQQSFDPTRQRLQVQLGLLGLHQGRPLRGGDREASVSLSMLGNCPMKSSRLRIMTGFLHGNSGFEASNY